MNQITNRAGEGGSDQVLARFKMSREVRLVDTDATGIVHFAAYVRMMEETEYAFLRSCGLSVVLYDDKGTMGFPRLQASLQIARHLSFDDRIEVELRLVELDGKQVTYDFTIVDADGRVAVEGQFRAAFCRFPEKANPYAMLIPDHVMDKLASPASVESQSTETNPV